METETTFNKSALQEMLGDIFQAEGSYNEVKLGSATGIKSITERKHFGKYKIECM